MYSLKNDIAAYEKLQEATKAIRQVCGVDVLTSTDQAEAFSKGMQKIVSMTPAEKERIMNAPLSELKQKDKEIDFAVHVIQLNMKMLNDVMLGQGRYNPALAAESQREKSFHTAGMVSIDRAISLVDEINGMLADTNLDMGYAAAYRSVDTRGAKEAVVRDVLGDMRFEELEEHEPPELTNLGSMKDERVGFRRFGGGFRFSDYDWNLNILTLNEVLAGLRYTSAKTRTIAGYKELFLTGSAQASQAALSEYSGATAGTREAAWQEAANAIRTLNKAAYELKNNAANITKAANKKGANDQNAPLPVTAATPLIAYFNHAHYEFIDRMRSLTLNDVGINERLLHNITFVPTHLAPLSGAWSLQDANQKDEFGIKGTVKEKGLKSGVGLQLVIPGLRNINPIFADLSFGQDTRAATESTVIVAFERYNFAKYSRQATHVTLK